MSKILINGASCVRPFGAHEGPLRGPNARLRRAYSVFPPQDQIDYMVSNLEKIHCLILENKLI